MKAIWSDDSNLSSSNYEMHITNMCFKVIESDNEVFFLDDESDLSYDELRDAFESLYDEFKKLGHKYSSLKKSHACLIIEKYALEKKTCIVIYSNKVNQLEEENKALKEKSGQVEYHTSKVHSRL
jgi:agmatine/peptidylarginine deiminase